MSPGNFSNGGLDTFDERKGYIGIRLQQGVPLLDRDWNELEDIRRYFERMLREHYVGQGVPDLDGFAIRAPEFAADNDVMIAAGRCTVAGFDVWNQEVVLYSEQGDRDPLPPPLSANPDVLTLYLEPMVARIDSASDPDLRNEQDINLETCLRDRLEWAVRAVRQPAVPPAGSYVLAEIHRQPGDERIRPEMIVDRRRTLLNLAGAVDRLGSAEARLAALEEGLTRAQLDIEAMKRDLGRLFWEVRVESSTADALFGAKAAVAVTVTDRLGSPVQGATLSFSTDWGTLEPSVATTNSQGRASVDLLGVKTDGPVRLEDVGLLHRVSTKVNAAVLSNPGAIEYARIRFDPDEMAVISRYTPVGVLKDIGGDLPVGPIVSRPDYRTATVTVHAKETQGAIVRGVGSVQVRFGLWIRDWARTKIFDVTSKVAVGARIGDLLRQGLDDTGFDAGKVTQKLPHTLQAISDETQAAVKLSMFSDPDLSDDDLHGTGMLGQVIAQEATAAVGARTNQSISKQLDQFVATPEVPLDAGQAKVAHTQIVQTSSQIAAGFAQSQKQLFSTAKLGL